MFLREDLFFGRTLAGCLSLALGLEHSCPWPRESLPSESRSLASDFLCPWPWPLALIVPSTPPLLIGVIYIVILQLS